MMKVGVFCNISALQLSLCSGETDKNRTVKNRRVTKGFFGRVKKSVPPVNPAVVKDQLLLDKKTELDPKKLQDTVDYLMGFYRGEEAQIDTNLKKKWDVVYEVFNVFNGVEKDIVKKAIQEKALEKFEQLLKLAIEPYPKQSIKIAKGIAFHGLFKKEGEQWFLTPTVSHQKFDGVDKQRSSNVTFEVGEAYTIHKIALENEESLSYPENATEIDGLLKGDQLTQQLQLTVSFPIEHELLAQGKAVLQIYTGLAPKIPMSSYDSVEAFRIQISVFNTVFTDEKAVCSEAKALDLFELLVKKFEDLVKEFESEEIKQSNLDKEIVSKFNSLPETFSAHISTDSVITESSAIKMFDELHATYQSFHLRKGRFTANEYKDLWWTFYNVLDSIIKHQFTRLRTSTNETELKKNYDYGSIVLHNQRMDEIILMTHYCSEQFYSFMMKDYRDQLPAQKQRIFLKNSRTLKDAQPANKSIYRKISRTVSGF